MLPKQIACGEAIVGAGAGKRWASSFAAPTRRGWHRHHLLPSHIQRFPDLRRFVGGFSDLGFRLGDFGTNGMFLPAEEVIAQAARLPLHRGPHWHYNDIVIDALDTIRLSRRHTGLSRCAQFGALRALQEQLRAALQTSARDADVALGSRDPFGRTAVLAVLDIQTDALFAAALGQT